MIEKRTVFILGAGASCPYRFPTARELREHILTECDKWYAKQYVHGFDTENAVNLIAAGYPDQATLQRFVKSFDLSSTESIDLFLSRNPQLVTMGKIAISLAILYEERGSHFRERVAESKLDWYFYLYNRLTRELTSPNSGDDFPRGHIAFITFNYDRSLEHFLFNSILHSFEGMDSARARELVVRIPILHVYGQIGKLHWQKAETGVKYGSEIADFSQIDLLGVIRNLYVVHEERANPQLERAREEISKADRIFFLGFGYADENLEALGIPDSLRAEHEILGTAMGWTPKEIGDIRSRLAEGLRRGGNILGGRDQVQIRDCDCVSLLREFL